MSLHLFCVLILALPLTQAWVPKYLQEIEVSPGHKKLWKPNRFQTGIEFSEISRSSLLRIMRQFAQDVEARKRGRNLSPQFTARFENNKFTRPFIYPHVFKTSLFKMTTVSQFIPEEDPGLCTRTGLKQVSYALNACSVELSIGMAYGSAAVMLPQVESSDMGITTAEGAWLVSVIYLFVPVGNLISGWVMDRFGRRSAIMLGTLPVFLGWIYTGIATNVTNIIIGRAITGFGCGMATAPPRIYIAEISLPNLRGALGSLSPLTTSFGMTLQALLGSMLNWKTTCYLCAGYTIGVFILSLFLPETPYYLMKKDYTQEQIAYSLKKFRGDNYNLDLELEAMEDFKSENRIRRLSCCGEFRELFKKSVCRPFCIVATYILLAQLSGIAVMIQWTVTILDESKISINSNVVNVAMSLTRFLTLILVAFLIYKMRRKVLALISSIGVCISSLAIYFHLMYSTGPELYPVLMYIIYTFFSTFGFYCLPFIIMSEIYPLQVRGLLGGLTLASTNAESFLMTKIYPDLRSVFSLATIFLIFSISCFVGSLYLLRYLPETKGLTLQEIEEYYNKRRPMLVSSRHLLSTQNLGRSMQNVNRPS